MPRKYVLLWFNEKLNHTTHLPVSMPANPKGCWEKGRPCVTSLFIMVHDAITAGTGCFQMHVTYSKQSHGGKRCACEKTKTCSTTECDTLGWVDVDHPMFPIFFFLHVCVTRLSVRAVLTAMSLCDPAGSYINTLLILQVFLWLTMGKK